jgi:hypothetical protein
METKICNVCNIEKELSSFYSIFDKRRNQYNNFASCRSCNKIKTNKWRNENPDKAKEIQRRSTIKNGKKFRKTFYENTIKKNFIAYSQRRKELKNKKNLPREELRKKLLVIQNNSCAICKKDFAKIERYDIDHSHKTGFIRGLLCRKCNSGLHYFENKEFIDKAQVYIKEHPAIKFEKVKY